MTLHAETRSDKNQPLSLDYIQSFDIADGTLTTSLVINLDGARIFRGLSTTPFKGQTHITVDWSSPPYSGVSHAEADSDGTSISGGIDGRAFGPVPLTADPASVVFADGGLSPVVGLPEPIAAAVKQITKKAREAAKFCPRPGQANGQAPAGTGATDFDFGHGSTPRDSFECGICIGGCWAAGAGGEQHAR